MHFNLTHIVPHERLHTVHGFAEVIATIRWGLTELGHTVDVRTNQFEIDRGVPSSSEGTC